MRHQRRPKPVNFTRQKIEEGDMLVFAGIKMQVWGTWTWIKFPARPNENVLKHMHVLLGKAWHFNGKREAWFCQEVVDLHLVAEALKPLLGAETITQFPAPRQEQMLFAEPEPAPAPTGEPRMVIHPFPEAEAIAAKLDELADKMQETIDYKRNPSISTQRPTRRRADIAQSMARDAERLEKIQTALRRLAEGHRGLARSDETALHPLLQGIRTRAQVEQLLFTWSGTLTTQEEIQRMKSANIPTFYFREASDLLKALLPGRSPESEKQMRLRQLERDLIGAQIPGYFPTPPELVQLMLRHADIQPHHQVMEPSAGKGNIADLIRAQHPQARLSCIEFQSQLREILKLKGHHVLPTLDFLEFQSFGVDRIVMNPPFGEHGSLEDVDHVRHAWEVLNEGGRIVAIMGVAPFNYASRSEARNKNERKAVEFRAWLEEVNATVEDIPAGMFDYTERPTGMPTKLVIIDKPKDNLLELPIPALKEETVNQNVNQGDDWWNEEEEPSLDLE